MAPLASQRGSVGRIRLWARLLGGCLIAGCLSAGCNSVTGLDVDLTGFDSLPDVAELDFSAVDPAQEWSYWELRMSWGMPVGRTVLGVGGTLLEDELPPETRAELEAIDLPSGFAGGCLPSWCFKYIVAVDGTGHVVTVSTREELRAFLGVTDSVAEAVLLLDAHGFHWSDDRQGIRRGDAGGWEAVVLELVRGCDPIQTDRVLVTVGMDGSVNVVDRELWQRLDGACI
ncbi:MAG: hypothetical protein WD960_00780 [Gemmatimonadota bacterium]